MVGSKKQGYAIAAVMAVLAIVSVALILQFQMQHHGTVPTAVGAAMEGVEQRFGVFDSAVFADATTPPRQARSTRSTTPTRIWAD